VSEQLCYPY